MCPALETDFDKIHKIEDVKTLEDGKIACNNAIEASKKEMQKCDEQMRVCQDKMNAIQRQIKLWQDFQDKMSGNEGKVSNEMRNAVNRFFQIKVPQTLSTSQSFETVGYIKKYQEELSKAKAEADNIQKAIDSVNKAITAEKDKIKLYDMRIGLIEFRETKPAEPSVSDRPAHYDPPSTTRASSPSSSVSSVSSDSVSTTPKSSSRAPIVSHFGAQQAQQRELKQTLANREEVVEVIPSEVAPKSEVSKPAADGLSQFKEKLPNKDEVKVLKDPNTKKPILEIPTTKTTSCFVEDIPDNPGAYKVTSKKEDLNNLEHIQKMCEMLLQDVKPGVEITLSSSLDEKLRGSLQTALQSVIDRDNIKGVTIKGVEAKKTDVKP